MNAKRWTRLLSAMIVVLTGTTTTVLVSAQPAEAAVIRPFTLNYNAEVYGDFILTGNGNSSCPGPTSPSDPFGEPIASCGQAQAGTYASSSGLNDSYYMRWADVDSNAATYNSSQASITIPAGATVAFARLGWSGDTGTIRLADGTVSAQPGCNTRQFLAGAGTAVLPAGTPESTSTRLTVGDGSPVAITPQVISRDALATVPASQPQFYAAYADVTSRFAGVATGSPLTLTLGNVWSPQGFGCHSGWSLSVVYSYDGPDVNAPIKKGVFLYDGHVRQSSVDPATTVNVSGFRAIAPGARVGVTGYEGDLNISGDQFQINGTAIAASGTTTNFFTSRTDFSVNPAVVNNMSVDARAIDAPIPAGATSASASFATSGDTFLATGLALSVPIASLELTSTASPVGPYLAGAPIVYTIRVASPGSPATDVVVDSPIDECDRTIGDLSANQSISYTCTVQAPADDTTVTNTVTGLSASGGDLRDSTTIGIDVIHPAVEITATADQPTYTSGQTITFAIHVDNTGDVPLSNVTISDPTVPSCASSRPTLDVDEEIVYNCTALAPITSGSNTATVTADHVGGTVDDTSTVEVPTVGTVSGRVFADRDDDGVVDPGETGIGDVSVALSGFPTTGSSISLTTSTNSTGDYVFTGVPGGTYTVAEAQPSAFDTGISTPGTNAVAGAGVDVIEVTLEPGQSSTGNLFAERPTSSLSGEVYNDLDADGTRDAGEPGIADVVVALSGVDSEDNAVSLTATTSATGAYLFSALRSGTYELVETQPAGYADGIDTAGTAGGSAAPDTITQIVLPDRTTATGYLFGETTGALSGAVYDDLDGSGARDAGEPGIGGVTVTLTGTDAAGALDPVATTTSANGDYEFPQLLAGTYTITETQPTAYGDGTETLGTSGGAVGSDSFTAITLPAGTSGTGYLFGETTGSISLAIFHDTDGDGTRGAADPGLEGVSVTLSGTDVLGTDVNIAATTSADGGHAFTGLLAGSYTITETQPSGFADGSETLGTAGGVLTAPDSITQIELPGGTAATGYLFAEKRGSLSGRVWLDADTDGIEDSEEAGVEGVTVALYGGASASDPVTTVVTGADGDYVFLDLPAGSYRIGVDPGTGQALTVPAQPDDETGSVVDWLTGLSSELVVSLDDGVNTNRGGIDAGIVERADDLAVTLTAAPSSVTVGDDVRFTALVSNHGISPTTGATLTITLPAGVQFDGGEGDGWSCEVSDQTAGCTTSDIVLPDASLPPVTLTGTTTAAGTDPATAVVAFADTDTDTTVDVEVENNTSTAPLTIVAVVVPPVDPTDEPTEQPTDEPTDEPTEQPTAAPAPSPASPASPAAGSGLPQTGSDSGLLITVSLMLLAGGVLVLALTLAGRRRTR
ncbi:SdrD B-like domain-containing protein [Compostimonas suwonensis]|uniref:Putative repeat protein (TIGR01451 family) n=1 Tax=Compostimonas suwonensis TaxID=1048394 RepID=A0A2M9BVS9_9MICO|nr:SdrD B-like domain-containing protein [Compostimonas suwonensis]PJJ62053.1 putative repeat protein (TIGR01451 family) [Compostimonas suwonensis]